MADDNNKIHDLKQLTRQETFVNFYKFLIMMMMMM